MAFHWKNTDLSNPKCFWKYIGCSELSKTTGRVPPTELYLLSCQRAGTSMSQGSPTMQIAPAYGIQTSPCHRARKSQEPELGVWKPSETQFELELSGFLGFLPQSQEVLGWASRACSSGTALPGRLPRVQRPQGF